MFTTAANADWANIAIAVANARANVTTRLILAPPLEVQLVAEEIGRTRKNYSVLRRELPGSCCPS